MRDLVISLILFALMIGAMVGNSLFVGRETDELICAVEDIPSLDSPSCELRIKELRIHWRDFKKIARLSLNYSEINRMECLIDELECHKQTGNVNDFEHAKVMMLNLLREMIRQERVTFDGIM